jgi:hypothetical protein
MGAPLPSKANYVLVEPLPGGQFTARGSATTSHRLAFFNPSPFGTLNDAIASAKTWAEENNVPVIYVKTGS